MQISNEGNNVNSHGVINASALAEVVWTHGSFPLYSILSSSYMEGVWSSPTEIASGVTDDAKVGIDAEGNAVAIWTEKQAEKESDHFVIRTASKSVGQAWSHPFTLSESALNFNPKLVMNESGVAIAAWLDVVSNTINASYLKFGKSWSSPVVVASSAAEFDLSLDSSGNGYLIWTSFSRNQVYAAVSSGALWGAEVCLKSDVYCQTPKISAGDLNDALATWNELFPPSVESIHYSKEWALVPETISNAPSALSSLSVSEENGFTVWQNSETGEIQGASWNQKWAPIADISSGMNNGSLSVSMRLDGSALVAWCDNSYVNALFYPEEADNKTVLSSEGPHLNVQAITRSMASMVLWQTGDHIFASINN